ncbi:MAG: energy transducer TonB [Bacteroidota bacterium]
MKKSKASNLENKRKSLLTMGLLIACCFSLCSFEWANFRNLEVRNFDYNEELIEEDIIMPTYHQKKAKQQVVMKKQQKMNLIAEIIEGEATEEEIEFEEIDFDEEEPHFEEPGMPDELIDEEHIFTIVEEQPEFPGGDLAMKKFLNENMDYPRLALEAGIHGTVYLTFVVDQEGNIDNVEILRGIGGGCDGEAVSVVSKMPKWKPGKQRGKPVKVQFNMPITFSTY